MKKIIIVIQFAFLSLLIGSAQQRTANISFKTVDHDFGNIKEVAGPVSVTFSFINTGGAPVILQDVTSSCGCTTPAYTKSPVMPGDSGFVKATFDPNGRPGPFSKDITVKSNAGNSPIILRIKGSVTPRELKVEDQYRFAVGSVRLETSHLGFGKLNYGSTKVLILKMMNTSDKKVKLGYSNLPAFLKVKSPVVELKPKESKEIEVTYDTKLKNDWGFLIDYLYLTVDGKQDPNYKITISAEIIEDFAKLTSQQKINSPTIVFDNTNYDFGYVKEGAVVEYIFKFTNKGKSDLNIRKVSSTCSCTVTEPELKVIKPGQSSFIKASFNTKGYKNSQTKPVTVVSNDPKASQITLWMKGVVRPSADSAAQ